VGGALSETELVEVVAAVGLLEGRIVRTFDCYEGTSAKAKLNLDLKVRGANLLAVKAR